jgi:hypothetical protein
MSVENIIRMYQKLAPVVNTRIGHPQCDQEVLVEITQAGQLAQKAEKEQQLVAEHKNLALERKLKRYVSYYPPFFIDQVLRLLESAEKLKKQGNMRGANAKERDVLKLMATFSLPTEAYDYTPVELVLFDYHKYTQRIREFAVQNPEIRLTLRQLDNLFLSSKDYQESEEEIEGLKNQKMEEVKQLQALVIKLVPIDQILLRREANLEAGKKEKAMIDRMSAISDFEDIEKDIAVIQDGRKKFDANWI